MSDELAIHGGAPIRSGPWPAWPEFGEPERAAARRVLESGSWGGHPSPNDEARAFSREFADFIGTDFAVPCTNGTVAITLALQAARISPGADVITAAYTFVGTAGAIIAAGCRPVLVDVVPGTYCIDPDAAAAAVGPRTEAVVPVHLGCSLADLDRLTALCDRRGLVLVEDCAHAHGARWRDRGAGSVGRLGAFSMQSSKLLTAGEGGAVTTSDALCAERLQSLVNCGRKEPGYDRFPERMLGHNARMTEWQAALLRAQLERLPEQNERRSVQVDRFERGLRALPGLAPMLRDERVTTRTSYQLIVRYDATEFADVPRDHVVAALRAEGIPCAGRFYLPLPDDPLFAADPHTNAATRAGADYAALYLPVARRAAYEEAIWLPHPLFLGGDADTDDILGAFARVRDGAEALRARPPEVGPDR